MVVLIDTEKVSITTEEISQLDNSVELVFFVSKNSKCMSPYCIGLLNKEGIKYQLETVDYEKTTKNCLDLHLVVYLTNEIASGAAGINDDYFIYSKDSDCSDVVNYINHLTGFKVGVVSSLNELKTKSKIISEKEEAIDQVVFKCVDNCSTMQEVYRFFIKEFRSKYSLAEIASIYNEQKERLTIELDLKTGKKEQLKPIAVKEGQKSVNQEEPIDKINETPKNDVKEDWISFEVDRQLWIEMKGLFGLFRKQNKSCPVTILCESVTVKTSKGSFSYDLCTFQITNITGVNIGDVFQLKCLKPKESSVTKIPVTSRNQKLINRFLKSLSEKIL